MLKGLDGKRVLITGAAGNIGLETVDRLVAEGAMVVASDINAEALADIAAKHGDRVATVATSPRHARAVPALATCPAWTDGTLRREPVTGMPLVWIARKRLGLAHMQ
ncbi:MAG TPA: SDR family NAD(P)-dependent oxidoreductase, partial [Ilumatobacteraceae bacterium]|nr:SDR family NAD(P)-dependent oxidoreductase [Ilumatobacteraceae bacterium]